MANSTPGHTNAEAYDRIADQWEEVRGRAVIEPLVVDFAARLVPGAHVLDIGCGTGYPIAQYLVRQGFHVTGIDPAERMLERAKALALQNAEFHVADVLTYEPSRTFGGIIAFDSLFHLPKAAQAGIHARIAAWMEPGAYLLFTHGNREGEVVGEMFGEVFHYSCLDTAAVHTLLEACGLEVIRSIEKYSVPGMERDLVMLARKRG